MILSVGTFSLHLEKEPNSAAWQLREQNQNWDLLTSLAESFYPQVQEISLKIVFEHGFTPDTTDALRAYALRPLNPVPLPYLTKFEEIDWSQSYQTEQLKAIVLAGMRSDSSVRLLETILLNSRSDMRDGPLYAASAHSDSTIIQAVVGIAQRLCGQPIDGTGDLSAIGFCIRRWLKENLITIQDLTRQIASESDSPSEAINKRKFLNSVICNAWRELPFPGIETGH